MHPSLLMAPRQLGGPQQLVTGRRRFWREDDLRDSASGSGPPARHRDKRIIRMDYRARRLRTTMLLGTAFLAGVAIGPASGLFASHLARGLAINSAFAQDTDRANTYRLLTLFGDVFERVRRQYVDPVSDKELVENAVNGMLTGLDPHSGYMNAEQFRAMQVVRRRSVAGSSPRSACGYAQFW
jgi:hypothetical protein